MMASRKGLALVTLLGDIAADLFHAKTQRREEAEHAVSAPQAQSMLEWRFAPKSSLSLLASWRLGVRLFLSSAPQVARSGGVS